MQNWEEMHKFGSSESVPADFSTPPGKGVQGASFLPTGPRRGLLTGLTTEQPTAASPGQGLTGHDGARLWANTSLHPGYYFLEAGFTVRSP